MISHSFAKWTTGFSLVLVSLGTISCGMQAEDDGDSQTNAVISEFSAALKTELTERGVDSALADQVTTGAEAAAAQETSQFTMRGVRFAAVELTEEQATSLALAKGYMGGVIQVLNELTLDSETLNTIAQALAAVAMRAGQFVSLKDHPQLGDIMDAGVVASIAGLHAKVSDSQRPEFLKEIVAEALATLEETYTGTELLSWLEVVTQAGTRALTVISGSSGGTPSFDLDSYFSGSLPNASSLNSTSTDPYWSALQSAIAGSIDSDFITKSGGSFDDIMKSTLAKQTEAMAELGFSHTGIQNGFEEFIESFVANLDSSLISDFTNSIGTYLDEALPEAGSAFYSSGAFDTSQFSSIISNAYSTAYGSTYTGTVSVSISYTGSSSGGGGAGTCSAFAGPGGETYAASSTQLSTPGMFNISLAGQMFQAQQNATLRRMIFSGFASSFSANVHLIEATTDALISSGTLSPSNQVATFTNQSVGSPSAPGDLAITLSSPVSLTLGKYYFIAFSVQAGTFTPWETTTGASAFNPGTVFIEFLSSMNYSGSSSTSPNDFKLQLFDCL